MKTIVAWTLVLLVGLGLAAVPSSAQEATSSPITLVPFVDSTYDIQGVVPQGWNPGGSGVHLRAASDQDVGLIIQQSAPAAAADVMKALLPQLGLTRAPNTAANYETPFATWTLYRVNNVSRGVDVTIDLALAQFGNTTYLVMMQSARSEYESLHADVFLPVLVAFSHSTAGDAADYTVENVTIKNTNALLSGTITLPKTGGPFAAVVLITGSGPHNRDEVLGNGIPIAPFALLADALTRSGLAVLRYDERGVGQSTGDYVSSTLDDFALDAAAAVGYLYTRKDINPAQIGVLGHSEGGYVAAKLGAHDPQVSFIIMMAAPGVSGRSLMLRQSIRADEMAGVPQPQIDDKLDYLRQVFDAVDKGDFETLDPLVYNHTLADAQALPGVQRVLIGNLPQYARQTTDDLMANYKSGWFKSFLDYDPVNDLGMVTVPVLALYGGLDVQIDSQQNAPALSAALAAGGNHDVSLVVLPKANHLFQDAMTGSVDEYATLPAKFTPDFLPTMVKWLKDRVTLSSGS